MKTRLSLVLLVLLLLVVGGYFILKKNPETEGRKSGNQSNTKQKSKKPPVGDQEKTTVSTDKTYKVMANELAATEKSTAIRWGHVYKGTRTYFNTFGVTDKVPQVELRMWKREKGGELQPWSGNFIEIACLSMPVTEADASSSQCQRFKDQDPSKGRIHMHTFRYALFSPGYSPEKGKEIGNFLRFGQKYEIEFREEKGKRVGRARIETPTSLKDGQVAIFNLVANEYDPPLPNVKVYTVKGRVTDFPKGYPEDLTACFFSKGVYELCRVDKAGGFSFSLSSPPSGSIFIEGGRAEGKVMAMVRDFSGKKLEFPRDATLIAREKDMVEVKVALPDRFMSSSPKGRAIYYLTARGKKTMLTDELIFSYHRDKIYPKEVDEYRQSKTIHLKYVPGKYSIYGWLGGEDHSLVYVGNIEIRKSDQGKVVELISPQDVK